MSSEQPNNAWMPRAAARIAQLRAYGEIPQSAMVDIMREEQAWHIKTDREEAEVHINVEMTDRLFLFNPGKDGSASTVVPLRAEGDGRRLTGAISVRDCLCEMIRLIDSGSKKFTKMVALVHYRDKGTEDGVPDSVGYHAAGPMNRLEVIGTCQNAAVMFAAGSWGGNGSD